MIISHYYKLKFIFYADMLTYIFQNSHSLAEPGLHSHVFPSWKKPASRKKWGQENKKEPAYHPFRTEASRYTAMADAVQVVVLASLGTLQSFSSWVVCRTDKSFHGGSACQAPFYFKKKKNQFTKNWIRTQVLLAQYFSKGWINIVIRKLGYRMKQHHYACHCKCKSLYIPMKWPNHKSMYSNKEAKEATRFNSRLH